MDARLKLARNYHTRTDEKKKRDRQKESTSKAGVKVLASTLRCEDNTHPYLPQIAFFFLVTNEPDLS